jgi:hypothetical protein
MNFVELCVAIPGRKFKSDGFSPFDFPNQQSLTLPSLPLSPFSEFSSLFIYPENEF